MRKERGRKLPRERKPEERKKRDPILGAGVLHLATWSLPPPSSLGLRPAVVGALSLAAGGGGRVGESQKRLNGPGGASWAGG